MVNAQPQDNLIESLAERYRTELHDICWEIFESKYTVLSGFLSDIVQCSDCRSTASPHYLALEASMHEVVAQEARFVLDTPEVESAVADVRWRSFRELLLNHMVTLQVCSRHKDANTRVQECAMLCKTFRSVIIGCRELLEKAAISGVRCVQSGDIEEAVFLGDDTIIKTKVNVYLLLIPILAFAPSSR